MNKCPITGKSCKEDKKIEISEIVDGVCRNITACDGCASAFLQGDLTLPKSVAGIQSNFVLPKMPGLKDKKNLILKCPNCDCSTEDIAKLGRFNCPICPSFFEGNKGLYQPRNRPLSSINSDSNYAVAKALNRSFKILVEKEEELKSNLTKSMSLHNFEEAIKIRDDLKKINLIKIEKEKIEKQISECVYQENYEKAAELKIEVMALLDGMANNLAISGQF